MILTNLVLSNGVKISLLTFIICDVFFAISAVTRRQKCIPISADNTHKPKTVYASVFRNTRVHIQLYHACFHIACGLTVYGFACQQLCAPSIKPVPSFVLKELKLFYLSTGLLTNGPVEQGPHFVVFGIRSLSSYVRHRGSILCDVILNTRKRQMQGRGSGGG